jgi:hypothetical protein
VFQENLDDMPLVPVSRDEFAELVAASNDGDQEALTSLKQLLDDCPAIWHQVADLASDARTYLVKLVSGGDALTSESVARKLKLMEAELTGPNPTLLERLAVEHLLNSWLMREQSDLVMAAAQAKGRPPSRIQLLQQDQAARRYQAAVRNLQDVKRLASQTAAVASKQGSSSDRKANAKPQGQKQQSSDAAGAAQPTESPARSWLPWSRRA